MEYEKFHTTREKGSCRAKTWLGFVEFLMTAEGIVELTDEILKSLRLKLYLWRTWKFQEFLAVGWNIFNNERSLSLLLVRGVSRDFSMGASGYFVSTNPPLESDP